MTREVNLKTIETYLQSERAAVDVAALLTAQTKEELMDRKRANQVFVVSSIKQRSLAEDLNEYLDEARGDPDEKALEGVERFSPDDERLTDKVCSEFASALYEANADDDDSGYQEARAESLYSILVSAARAGRRGIRKPARR